LRDDPRGRSGPFHAHCGAFAQEEKKAACRRQVRRVPRARTRLPPRGLSSLLATEGHAAVAMTGGSNPLAARARPWNCSFAFLAVLKGAPASVWCPAGARDPDQHVRALVARLVTNRGAKTDPAAGINAAVLPHQATSLRGQWSARAVPRAGCNGRFAGGQRQPHERFPFGGWVWFMTPGLMRPARSRGYHGRPPYAPTIGRSRLPGNSLVNTPLSNLRPSLDD
jgi:hypothetical protein